MTVEIFTEPGTWNLPDGVTEVDVIIIGGGGGGGRGGGGGGGAGGVVQQSGVAVDAPVTIAVGAGGAGGASDRGASGGDSSFGGATAVGGGGGGARNLTSTVNGLAGGSGGGGTGGAGFQGGGTAGVGGLGVEGQGSAGGNGTSGDSTAAGGGGAGAAGQSTDVVTIGGAGGAGAFIQELLDEGLGVDGWVGGGGGGHWAGAGGQGGGGTAAGDNVTSGGDAIAGTGGGGGGAGSSAPRGGNGGSGLVVVRHTGTSIVVLEPRPVQSKVVGRLGGSLDAPPLASSSVVVMATQWWSTASAIPAFTVSGLGGSWERVGNNLQTYVGAEMWVCHDPDGVSAEVAISDIGGGAAGDAVVLELENCGDLIVGPVKTHNTVNGFTYTGPLVTPAETTDIIIIALMSTNGGTFSSFSDSGGDAWTSLKNSPHSMAAWLNPSDLNGKRRTYNMSQGFRYASIGVAFSGVALPPEAGLSIHVGLLRATGVRRGTSEVQKMYVGSSQLT